MSGIGGSWPTLVKQGIDEADGIRDAWIAGMTRHYLGTPKSGYIAP